MDHTALLSSFPFESPAVPVSLYKYAPVLRVTDRRGDWVLKRTGLVHSSGVAIGNWLTALHTLGIRVVAPAAHLAPNPRRLLDGKEWVVYPFVPGTGYSASLDEIRAAGQLLGQMHAADPPEVHGLATYDAPVVRTADWIERHLASAADAMRQCGLNPAPLRAAAMARAERAMPVEGLPLAGCSFDFKASNLVFDPAPTLVDPDHAARMPRMYDLAIALLLFHGDLPSAPGRVWQDAEWRAFINGYRAHAALTEHEVDSWAMILSLAWLDQAVWLLGNWQEGWAETKEREYLVDLAALDLGRFMLSP